MKDETGGEISISHTHDEPTVEADPHPVQQPGPPPPIQLNGTEGYEGMGGELALSPTTLHIHTSLLMIAKQAGVKGQGRRQPGRFEAAAGGVEEGEEEQEEEEDGFRLEEEGDGVQEGEGEVEAGRGEYEEADEETTGRSRKSRGRRRRGVTARLICRAMLEQQHAAKADEGSQCTPTRLPTRTRE